LICRKTIRIGSASSLRPCRKPSRPCKADLAHTGDSNARDRTLSPRLSPRQDPEGIHTSRPAEPLVQVLFQGVEACHSEPRRIEVRSRLSAIAKVTYRLKAILLLFQHTTTSTAPNHQPLHDLDPKTPDICTHIYGLVRGIFTRTFAQ
jgi:hypothetical protein